MQTSLTARVRTFQHGEIVVDFDARDARVDTKAEYDALVRELAKWAGRMRMAGAVLGLEASQLAQMGIPPSFYLRRPVSRPCAPAAEVQALKRAIKTAMRAEGVTVVPESKPLSWQVR